MIGKGNNVIKTHSRMTKGHSCVTPFSKCNIEISILLDGKQAALSRAVNLPDPEQETSKSVLTVVVSYVYIQKGDRM